MTLADDTTAERTAVPYLSFATFKNFIDGLSTGRPLPPRIDRSLMVGMAGGTQTLLIGTLTVFNLITEDKDVTPLFVSLVSTPEDERPAIYADMLRETYGPQLALAADHATADQLQESFRALTDYQGSTLRKAISFFLNMAKYAGVQLSPYFKTPAQGRPTGARVRARRAKTVIEPAGAPAAPQSAGESQTITLASGGSVTVSCSTAFLSLSREDRQFVFELVDRLTEYRESHRTADGDPA
ncbi:DUF5343 domain-containing protein [Cellulomonas endometrii]|uniref:DUF5343 domain-containing protein n=1 Tax=Cellulomonas endometrii TaxID=3036301 RepID=UPI0024ACD57A|nr:DUF5343 domain-containing protein [Cellulomonas endometrii]